MTDDLEGVSSQIREVLRIVHIVLAPVIAVTATYTILGASGVLEAFTAFAAALVAVVVWYIVGVALGLRAEKRAERRPA